MQKIIYWFQSDWKAKLWLKLSRKLWESFVDLDKYIVSEKLNWKLVNNFIDSFNDKCKWWVAFRDFEHNSLREVLTFWFQIISLWWWTMFFDRNRDILSNFETLKIFLEVNVKSQLEKLISWDVAWNQNETSQKNLKKLYIMKNNIYQNNSDISFDISKYNEKELVNLVAHKVRFVEWVLPLRREIDNCDDSLINLFLNKNDTLSYTSIDSPFVIYKDFMPIVEKLSFKMKQSFFMELDDIMKSILLKRIYLVCKIWKLKRKYNEEVVQNNRKKQVRDKWILSWWEKFWKIYDLIHDTCVNIEKTV